MLLIAAALPALTAVHAGAKVNVTCTKPANTAWPTPLIVKLKAQQGIAPCSDEDEKSVTVVVDQRPTVNVTGPTTGSLCTSEETKTFTYTFSPPTATVTSSASNGVGCTTGEPPHGMPRG